MYIPTPFREERRDVLHDLMRQHSFATMVSATDDGPIATHIPILLDPARGDRGVLIGHVARENPHWRAFRDDHDSLIIFQGPHAYISPTWYTTPYAVPTWNYVAVHAYGRPRVVEDEVGLYQIVAETVRTFEARFDYAWDLEARSDYARKLLKNIVGFEMEITRLEGKRKLSQNRSQADQESVINALTTQGGALDLAVAAVMRDGLG
jgi:transcriptional regulator